MRSLNPDKSEERRRRTENSFCVSFVLGFAGRETLFTSMSDQHGALKSQKVRVALRTCARVCEYVHMLASVGVVTISWSECFSSSWTSWSCNIYFFRIATSLKHFPYFQSLAGLYLYINIQAPLCGTALLQRLIAQLQFVHFEQATALLSPYTSNCDILSWDCISVRVLTLYLLYFWPCTISPATESSARCIWFTGSGPRPMLWGPPAAHPPEWSGLPVQMDSSSIRQGGVSASRA